MTKIRPLLASCAGVETEAQPDACLQLVLQTTKQAAEAAAGISLVPSAVIYSSSNELLHGWDNPQGKVGTQDLTVVFKASSQADVIGQLMLRMAAQEQMVALMAAPRISNAAAQVLNHACGELFRSAPESSKFLKLGEAHPSILQLSTLTNKAPHLIISDADDVINRRNNSYAHDSTADALKTEVNACMDIIKLNSSLRQKCRQECWVLENYDLLKTAFHLNQRWGGTQC